jgi:hypothetical protein
MSRVNSPMTDEQERYAGTFDRVADDYARERPTYPDELVERPCSNPAGGSP